MYYTNFKEHITRPYRIVVKNWPLKEFKNPSSISTRSDLSVLWNSLETGTTHFYRMNDAEYQQWEMEEERGTAERLQMPRDSIGGEQLAVEHNVPQTAMATAEPQQTPAPEFTSSNFVNIVTNVNGEALSTTSRQRKKRKDAGVPRGKRSKATQDNNRA